MSHLRLKQFLPSLLALLILCSCSDNSTSTEVIPEHCLKKSSNLAQINGSVKFADARKFKVLATNLTSKYSLDEINCPYSEAVTNAEGAFSLRVNEDDVEDLIIKASPKDDKASDYNTLTTFIPEPIQNGNTYQTKPMDYESTAEIQVYMHIAQDPNANDIHKSEIEGYISNISADKILSMDFFPQRNLSKIILATGAFRNYYLSTKFPGQAEQKKNQLFELLEKEYKKLVNALDTAADPIEVQESYRKYYASTLEAYYEIGLNHNERVEFLVVSQMDYTDFLRSELTSIAEIRADAYINEIKLSALAIKNALESNLDSTSLSNNTKQEILDTSESLISDIFNRVEVSSDYQQLSDIYDSEIRNIKEQYKEAVLSILKSDPSYQAYAYTIDRLQNRLNNDYKDYGAVVFLNLNIVHSNSPEDNFHIYQMYTGKVRRTVESYFSEKLSKEEVSDLTYIMRLINLL